MYVTITSFVHHPNSSRCTSFSIPLLQYSFTLFLNSTTELLLHPTCCTSHGSAMYATLLSFTLLNLFSLFCAFFFTRHASFFSCYTFCGLAIHITFSFLTHNRYSLHLCPFFPHLKHSISTTPTLFIILLSAPYCIILLLNTSNLFWGMTVFFSSFLLFLQLQARCPDPLQLKYNLPLLSSSSSLSLAREYFSLSKLLISELYYCKDIVLYLCKRHRFNN